MEYTRTPIHKTDRALPDGNMEFLVIAVNSLLGGNGLINIRNKKVAVPFFKPHKTATHKTKWHLMYIGLPLASILVFGLGFVYFRRRKRSV